MYRKARIYAARDGRSVPIQRDFELARDRLFGRTGGAAGKVSAGGEAGDASNKGK